ncbi:hypothetical protein KC966_18020, partial [Proteus terrae]|uniref:hypothetical protein n=1 Tax=Proteus terrae TaxID=1574161 RepID=UPI00331490BB
PVEIQMLSLPDTVTLQLSPVLIATELFPVTLICAKSPVLVTFYDQLMPFSRKLNIFRGWQSVVIGQTL